MALGMRLRSSTSSRRCSGCSPSAVPAHPTAPLVSPLAGPGDCTKVSGTGLSHMGLGFLHPPGCEGARPTAAVQIGGGGILEDDRAGRQVLAPLEDLLDDLEDRALAGDVCRPVDRAAPH